MNVKPEKLKTQTKMKLTPHTRNLTPITLMTT